MEQPGAQLGALSAVQLVQLLKLLKANNRPKKRLPKLAEFDGSRDKWEDWKIKAENKLAVDGAALKNPLQQLMYVHSRLIKKAAEITRVFVKSKRDTNSSTA